MPGFLRQLPIGLAAITMALALFIIMESLIHADRDLIKGDRDSAYLNFIRVKPSNRPPEQKDRSIPDEPPPPEPPPKMPNVELSQDQTLDTQTPQLSMNMPNLNVPLMGGGGPALGAVGNPAGGAQFGMSSDLVPLVRVPATYPRRAKQAGIEGKVILKVTVRPDGTVADAEVIEADPKRLFDDAAVRAVLRWKFKPKVVDGVAQQQVGKLPMIFQLRG